MVFVLFLLFTFCFSPFSVFHFQILINFYQTKPIPESRIEVDVLLSVINSGVKLKCKCQVIAGNKTRSRSIRCPIQQKFQSLHVIGFFRPDLSNTFNLPAKISLCPWTCSNRWTWSRIRWTSLEFQTSVEFC